MHWHWHSRVTLFCSWICWWLEGKLVSKEKNWLFIFCCLFFFNLKLSVACLKVGLHIVWFYSYSVAIIKMLCCFCDFFFPPICANKTKIRIWPLKSIFATDFSLLKEFTDFKDFRWRNSIGLSVVYLWSVLDMMLLPRKSLNTVKKVTCHSGIFPLIFSKSFDKSYIKKICIVVQMV